MRHARAAKFVLAGNRMVNAQSYLSKHKSYEKSSTNIFIEKTKPGKATTRGRGACQILTRLPFREKAPSDTGRVYNLKVITIYSFNVFGREEVNSVVRNSHRVQIPEHLSCGDAWNEPIPPAGGPLARPVLKQHTE